MYAGTTAGKSNASLKCHNHNGWPSTKLSGITNGVYPSTSIHGRSTELNNRSDIAAPVLPMPISVKLNAGCNSTGMSTSIGTNGHAGSCDKEPLLKNCFPMSCNPVSNCCLGNSCSSSAGSNARGAGRAHEPRPITQDESNTEGNRTKPNTAVVPQENTLCSAKRIQSQSAKCESSCSSNISYMDPNTRKILAALDSGELTSSLLENPFI